MEPTEYLASADTILALDFGAANTRALLFDVAAGQYRLVGLAQAPTTVDAPWLDMGEGMRQALADLQAITGRAVLDDNGRLLMPATNDGRGVDGFVATASAGPPVRTVLVGLLPEASLAALQRAAAGHYVQVLDTFSLGDRRDEEAQIAALIAARPDLILAAGGSDGGASEALVKLVETVSLACHLLPGQHKPRAIFMGNGSLAPRVSEVLARVAHLTTAPNIMPELGSERLGPANNELNHVLDELRQARVSGLAELAHWAAGRMLPTAQAAGLYARFLSRQPAWPRGVLLVDAGSASVTVAAALNGRLSLSVRTDLGVGANAASTLSLAERGLPGPKSSNGSEPAASQMARWLPFEASPDTVREFVLNKALHPHTLPADARDLHLEHALTRHVLSKAIASARHNWPAEVLSPRPALLPAFNLIVGGGAALAGAPRPGQAALMLLDAVQPAGITRLMLDPHHLSAALGAAAQAFPLVAAQVHSSAAFIDLGTAVCLLGRPRLGETACQVRLTPEGADEKDSPPVEVAWGSLAVLPLAHDRLARLHVRPRGGVNAGFGAGRPRSLTVKGGVLGVIIDARGRPLNLPRDDAARIKALQAWLATLESAPAEATALHSVST